METEPTDWILLSPVGIQPGSSFSAGLSLQARSERGPKTDDSKVFPFAAQLKKPRGGVWRKPLPNSGFTIIILISTACRPHHDGPPSLQRVQPFKK
jgi:hypothetical protein